MKFSKIEESHVTQSQLFENTITKYDEVCQSFNVKPRNLYHFIHKRQKEKIKKDPYWKMRKKNKISIEQTWENDIPEELPRNYTKEEMIKEKQKL